MKLITLEILKRVPDTSKDAGSDPMIHFKLFTPWSNWTWYIAQYDPQTGMMFGLCIGHEKEWGYVSLHELEEIRGPAGLKIERDIHFKPCKASELKI